MEWIRVDGLPIDCQRKYICCYQGRGREGGRGAEGERREKEREGERRREKEREGERRREKEREGEIRREKEGEGERGLERSESESVANQ